MSDTGDPDSPVHDSLESPSRESPYESPARGTPNHPIDEVKITVFPEEEAHDPLLPPAGEWTVLVRQGSFCVCAEPIRATLQWNVVSHWLDVYTIWSLDDVVQLTDLRHCGGCKISAMQ